MRQGLDKTQLNKLRVAITGAGTVSSIAQNVLTFTKRLQTRHTGIAHSQRFTDLPFPLSQLNLKTSSLRSLCNVFQNYLVLIS